MNLSYKQFHETFMQNHTGTSVEETIIIQSPIAFASFLAVYIVKNIDKHKLLCDSLSFGFIQFLVEFVLIVVSQILIFTLFYHNIYILFCIWTVGVFVITVICLRFTNEAVAQKISLKSIMNTTYVGKRPYITYFRTSVNLTTSICILAVDFTSFPRSLAKTEAFGFSLMDTGVGYFIVCNALVGRHKFKNDNVKNIHLMFEQFKQNFILFVLGLSRAIFTKGTDYQTHNSEYGVHWNFFLTLAFVRVLSTVLLTYVYAHQVKYLTVFIVTAHQLMLLCGVQNWVLSDIPRDNLINANREGIVSMSGYIGLYLFAVEFRNHFNLNVSSLKRDLYSFVILILSTSASYGSVLLLNSYFPCSRRLVNITYIMYIVMSSLFMLSSCLGFEMILRLSNGPKNISNSARFIPVILESINFNALSYFLFANILTGIVNISIETLFVSVGHSIFILVLYMFTSCFVIRYLYHKNLKII